MSNTKNTAAKNNNGFLVNIQETEAQAEKMVHDATEKKQQAVAMARSEGERKKQDTVSAARKKQQTALEKAESESKQKTADMIKAHEAETEKFIATKQKEAEKLNQEAFNELLSVIKSA